MTHFAEGFGLNLTNPFASDSKLLSDFFQGPRIAVAYSEA